MNRPTQSSPPTLAPRTDIQAGAELIHAAEVRSASAAGRKPKRPFLGLFLATIAILATTLGATVFHGDLSASPADVPGIYYKLPQIVVTGPMESNRNVHLKITPVVEVQTQKAADRVRLAERSIVANVKAALGKYQRSDLVGNSGADLIREVITRAIKQFADGDQAVNILLNEVVLLQ